MKKYDSELYYKYFKSHVLINIKKGSSNKFSSCEEIKQQLNSQLSYVQLKHSHFLDIPFIDGVVFEATPGEGIPLFQGCTFKIEKTKKLD